MKKSKHKIIFMIICLLLFVGGCTPTKEEKVVKPSTTPNFDFLNRLSLADVDKAIARKENLFIYFTWSKNSSECVKLQENYLEKYIEYYQWNGLISVVDLDEELPEALDNKDLRKELTEKFGFRYAPAFAMVKFGVVSSFIEWTPETNDLENGMDITLLGEWFKSVGIKS